MTLRGSSLGAAAIALSAGPGRSGEYPMISNATVNRSTTLVLKKLFTRAKTAWNIKFDRMINRRQHFLPEPDERVRELVGDEGQRIEEATRADYALLRVRPCVGSAARRVSATLA